MTTRRLENHPKIELHVHLEADPSIPITYRHDSVHVSPNPSATTSMTDPRSASS